MSTFTDHSQFGSSSESSTPASSADPVLGQPLLAFEQPIQVVPAFEQRGQADLVLGQPFLAFVVPAFEQPNQSDIDDLMPKLRHSDYYTKPTIHELAAKERAEPGYCCRVKDFVMGRHGHGSVRFLGETDVRRVDLEYFIKFNGKKFISKGENPPAGQGYNETAEITILEEKLSREEMFSCDTRARIIRHVEGLKMKLDDHGLEYVSYDPIKGEIKFRVKYFSGLGMILFKARRESKSPVARMLRQFLDLMN